MTGFADETLLSIHKPKRNYCLYICNEVLLYIIIRISSIRMEFLAGCFPPPLMSGIAEDKAEALDLRDFVTVSHLSDMISVKNVIKNKQTK